MQPVDNPVEHPSIHALKSINEDGFAIKLEKKPLALEQAYYWRLHENQIGLLLLLSMGILLMLLLQETDVFGSLWSNMYNAVFSVILKAVGLA
jgi:hypothetical protein